MPDRKIETPPFMRLLRLYKQMDEDRRLALVEAAEEILRFKPRTWEDTTPLGGLETKTTEFDPKA